MKKLLLALALATLGTVGASAATVTYSTNTSQLCVGAQGCNSLTQTIGGGTGVTITFNPVVNSSVNANPTTNASFGELVISCVGGGTACGSQSLTGLNLFINITQTSPAVGTGSISGGVIAGSVSGTASSATITWAIANTSIIVGETSVSYLVSNNPLDIVPPSVNSGQTSIQARITDNTIPEPSTYAMLASGLIGLGLLRRRVTRK